VLKRSCSSSLVRSRYLLSVSLHYIAENNIGLIQLGGVAKEPSDHPTAAPNASSSESTSQAVTRNFKHLLPSSSKPTSEDLVIAALTLVLEPKHYPLHLICSSGGRHRTGVVIGCFRKLQRWALSSIFAEYRRYAGGARGAADANNELMMNEQFIELFDIELVTTALGEKSVQKHLKALNIHNPTSAAFTSGGGGMKDSSREATGGSKSSFPSEAVKKLKESSRHQTPVPSPHTASSSVIPHGIESTSSAAAAAPLNVAIGAPTDVSRAAPNATT
jgi:hypothetical protein